MNSFAIMTDTVANINQKTADEWGVYLTPYVISLDGKEYLDGVDITVDEFFQKLPEAEDAKTAVPSPGEIMKTIDRVVEDGYKEVLVICSGANFTGMVNAVEMLKGNYPDLRMEVFDSQSVSMGTGFHVLHAKELKNEGKSLEEVLEILNNQAGKFMTIGIVEELDHLIKGGRLNQVTGTIGKFLKVIPILAVKPNGVEMIKSIRGDKKSLNYCVDLIREMIQEHSGSEYYLAFLTGENDNSLDYGKELLEEEIKKANYVFEAPLTPVIGIHAGGSAVVFSLYIKG